MDSSLKALHKNIAEWMAGPSGSIVLHVALLLAVLLLVDFSKPPVDEVFDVAYVDVDTPIIDLPPPALEPDDKPDIQDIAFDVPSFEDEVPAPPDIVQFDAPSPFDKSIDPFLIPEIPSKLVIKGLVAGPMQSRIGAEGHAEAGRKYGGPFWEHAEVSVKKALEWLRLNQNADGSWGINDREAMAGLGILTFLAHGETTASPHYGDTIRKALYFLVARQNAAGEFASVDTTGGTYAQAICVYAISEAFGMMRIPSLREPMEKGVAVLLRGQQSGGGFDYRFAKGTRRDTSLGGWCCQALKAAYIAGADNAGLKIAMDNAVADIRSAQKDDGSFYYSDRGSHSTHGITAVGVLSMQLLGYSRSAEVRRGLSYLNDARCDWKNPPAWPMYAWYYLSQAKFHEGGGSWHKWNNQFAPQLIRSQNSDGSWNSAGLAFSSGTAGRENYHPVYSTTLAALTLQVYYRFLPTYQPVDAQIRTQRSDDDVTIHIL